MRYWRSLALYRTPRGCPSPWRSRVGTDTSIAKLAPYPLDLHQIRQEGVDAFRVEVLAPLGLHEDDGFVDRPRVLVAPLAHQRVEDIRDSDDAGDDRYVIAHET